MAIYKEHVNLIPAGSDGSATASATTRPLSGIIQGIYIVYDSSQAATTDITFTMSDAPDALIFTVPDNKTSGWYTPSVDLYDSAGAAATYDGSEEIYALMPVDGALVVAAAQADNTHPIDVYIHVLV